MRLGLALGLVGALVWIGSGALAQTIPQTHAKKAGAAAAPSTAPSFAKATEGRSRGGIEGDWRFNFILSMESTPETPQLVVPEAAQGAVAAKAGQAMSDFFAKSLDPEVPMLVLQSDGLPIVRGQRRTRAVVQPADGRLPYTAAARKELDAEQPKSPIDNPEDRANSERCLVGSGQPPLSSIALDSQIRILVTRQAVAIYAEYGSDIRIIPLSRVHAPKALWSPWLGDSIAHWEGRTLVIETVGQPDGDRLRIAPFLIVPGEATVIEKLTAVSDRELLYQFTVVDPKIYAGPWLGEFSWFRTDKPVYEHACHEGNYSLANMLAGARYEEGVKAGAGK